MARPQAVISTLHAPHAPGRPRPGSLEGLGQGAHGANTHGRRDASGFDWDAGDTGGGKEPRRDVASGHAWAMPMALITAPARTPSTSPLRCRSKYASICSAFLQCLAQHVAADAAASLESRRLAAMAASKAVPLGQSPGPVAAAPVASDKSQKAWPATAVMSPVKVTAVSSISCVFIASRLRSA